MSPPRRRGAPLADGGADAAACAIAIAVAIACSGVTAATAAAFTTPQLPRGAANPGVTPLQATADGLALRRLEDTLGTEAPWNQPIPSLAELQAEAARTAEWRDTPTSSATSAVTAAATPDWNELCGKNRCNTCVAVEGCGFCPHTGTCMHGDAHGPLSWGDGAWEPLACNASTENFGPWTVSSHRGSNQSALCNWNRRTGVQTPSNPIIPLEYDTVCKNGGQRHWKFTGKAAGNAYCVCPKGWKGRECESCDADDVCDGYTDPKLNVSCAQTLLPYAKEDLLSKRFTCACAGPAAGICSFYTPELPGSLRIVVDYNHTGKSATVAMQTPVPMKIPAFFESGITFFGNLTDCDVETQMPGGCPKGTQYDWEGDNPCMKLTCNNVDLFGPAPAGKDCRDNHDADGRSWRYRHCPTYIDGVTDVEFLCQYADLAQAGTYRCAFSTGGFGPFALTCDTGTCVRSGVPPPQPRPPAQPWMTRDMWYAVIMGIPSLIGLAFFATCATVLLSRRRELQRLTAKDESKYRRRSRSRSRAASLGTSGGVGAPGGGGDDRRRARVESAERPLLGVGGSGDGESKPLVMGDVNAPFSDAERDIATERSLTFETPELMSPDTAAAGAGARRRPHRGNTSKGMDKSRDMSGDAGHNEGSRGSLSSSTSLPRRRGSSGDVGRASDRGVDGDGHDHQQGKGHGDPARAYNGPGSWSGRNSPEDAAEFSWASVTYTVRKPRRRPVLRGVSGRVKGAMMAVLGPSGAGKTSLLDILAGRKSTVGGDYGGSVRLNGFELTPEQLRRVSGYVLQDDVMMGTQTVREYLLFQARLRLPTRVTLQQRMRRVDRVLGQLGLRHVADTTIGGEFVRGISGGEKRRVSIAAELITDAEVLILDEPSSGLDSASAKAVVHALKAVARRGTSVIMSIHQPSSLLWEQFDAVTLLAKGGQMLYSGGRDGLLEHLRELGHVCRPNYNPADFLLDTVAEADAAEIARLEAACPPVRLDGIDISVTGGGPGEGAAPHPSGGGASAYGDGSRSGSGVEQLSVAPPTRLRATTAAFEHDAVSAYYRETATFSRQLWELALRTSMNIVRNPYALLLNYVATIGVAIGVATIFHQLPFDFYGLQDRFGFMFFSFLFFSMTSLSSLGVWREERLLFLRERAMGCYSSTAYFVAKVSCDLIPLRVLPPVIYTGIVYWSIGLQEGPLEVARFMMVMVVVNVLAATLCLAVGAAIESPALANLVASFLLLFQMLTCGLLSHNVQTDWSPMYILQKCSFLNYAFEILANNELVGETYNLSPKLPGGKVPPVFPASGSLIITTFGMSLDHMTIDPIMLGVYLVVLLLLTYSILNWWVKERR